MRHKQKVALLKQQLFQSKCVCLNPTLSHTLRSSSYKKNLTHLDFRSFNQILHLDEKKKQVTVEPKITVRQLSTFLYKKRLALPVVPEFASITIGGAIMGAAIESSSSHYGQLSDCCIACELLLATGELIEASPTKHPELFYGIMCSYGTIALALKFTFQLIDVKKYIHCKLTRTSSDSVISKLQTDTNFIEAIVYSKEKSVVIEGTFTDQIRTKVLTTKSKDPWYLEAVAKEKSFQMPFLDYLFRLNRGAFWMGQYLLHPPLILQALLRKDLVTLPQKIQERASCINKELGASYWVRKFFDPLLNSKGLYRLWHQVPQEISEKLFFVQDFYLPLSIAQKNLDLYMQELEIFPIWLCPVKNTKTPQYLSPNYHQEFLIDIGLYGICKNDVIEETKRLETKLLLEGGKKMLYSYTYLDKELFNQCYQEKRLRELSQADKLFLTLYDKVVNH